MKNRKNISIEEAKEKYGITTEFYVMPTNEEARFRLNSDDGTAYVRTETKDEAEGWQNAHYHRGLSETYIVQKGEILFVEFKNNEIFCQIYKQGEMFTIAKNVPHNVYMMKKSIIHTIKHSEPVFHPKKLEEKADWWNNADGCEKLNLLKNNSIEEIKNNFEKIIEQPEQAGKSNIIVLEKKESPYNTAYRHFDNLIWQFPVWIFGLLTVGIAIIGLFSEDLSKNINFLIIWDEQIQLSDIIGFGLIFSGLLGAILAYAMYRFRYHQTIIKDSGKRRVLSPQILIQVFSNILVVILFLIGFGLIFGELTMSNILVVIIPFVIITVISEIYLGKCLNRKEHEENEMS